MKLTKINAEPGSSPFVVDSPTLSVVDDSACGMKRFSGQGCIMTGANNEQSNRGCPID
jgi:hypothetical protein